MGSRIFYLIKTQFDFVNKVALHDFFYENICRPITCFWSFFCGYTLYLFGLFFRFQQSKTIDNYESNSNEVNNGEDDNQIGSSCCPDSNIDQRNGERENSLVTNRYEFSSSKGVFGLMEEPRKMNLIVHESFIDSNSIDKIISNPIFDTGGGSTEEEEAFYDVGLDAEEEENAEKSSVIEEEQEMSYKLEELVSNDKITSDEGIGNQEFDAEESENSSGDGEIDDSDQSFDHLLSKCQSFGGDEEDASNDELSLRKDELSGNATGREVSDEEESVACFEVEKEEDIREAKPNFNEVVSMEDHSTDSEEDGEYIEIQPEKQKNNSILFSREDSSNVVVEQQEKEGFDFERCEENRFKDEKSSSNDETDYNMFEHQDIIEQLKMELKLARTGGLPTILEESESEELETPKPLQENLKPMKIDQNKFEHKDDDVLDGIQKVYKSYLDRMRKLDILNFQTMHALGLLQMKDTVQFQAARKSSAAVAITSIISQNLWLCKGSAVVDPLKKVIADMNGIFETIYIGQLCLSWEVLHWQYKKVQELRQFDSHQYNQVAGEFQLFQVLIHRFLENEQFQGPRVQNYVRNRCVLRSLLQVPLVKDDCIKDKDAITNQMLTSTIEESMRIVWEFLRADRDQISNVIFQDPNLQDRVVLELWTDVRTDFQKKDKKLKDILRSGNCIVKRFKKQQENGVHQTLLIAQVELKLISRVLNMSNLTIDQLIWCHEKLDKINFCNRKAFVESSFLLFPC